MEEMTGGFGSGRLPSDGLPCDGPYPGNITAWDHSQDLEVQWPSATMFSDATGPAAFVPGSRGNWGAAPRPYQQMPGGPTHNRSLGSGPPRAGSGRSHPKRAAPGSE
jgi:hypothetical protein